MELQREILRYCPNSKQIVLLGDFNSRTGEKEDFCPFDDYISEIYELQVLAGNTDEIIDRFSRNNIPLKRVNADMVVNSYGNQMIEFCRATNLFILNGRYGRDKQNSKPNFTCKDRNTVDYFLSTSNLFSMIQSVEVLEFNDLFSDVHCPLSLAAHQHLSSLQNSRK